MHEADTQRDRARECLAHEFSVRGQPSVALAIRSGNLNEDGPYAPAVAAMLAFATPTKADSNAVPVGEHGLRDAASALLAQFDKYQGSGLNYECAHRYLARYEMWETLRAALASQPIAPAVAEGVYVVDPQPEIIGDPLCKIVSYNQTHEDAVEMGYPSITEALEHLDELRTTPPAVADVAGLVGELKETLTPFAELCENFVGEDEDDLDLYQPTYIDRQKFVLVGWLRRATVALNSLDALEARAQIVGDMVMVPREPTYEMLKAACDELDKGGKIVTNMWSAMISALPPVAVTVEKEGEA